MHIQQGILVCADRELGLRVSQTFPASYRAYTHVPWRRRNHSPVPGFPTSLGRSCTFSRPVWPCLLDGQMAAVWVTVYRQAPARACWLGRLQSQNSRTDCQHWMDLAARSHRVGCGADLKMRAILCPINHSSQGMGWARSALKGDCGCLSWRTS